jgi:ABC-type transport system involved in multi-copper enzyme maturation permease subunit
MTLLPILERELRVRARRRATYWMRVVVALSALLFCLPVLLGAYRPWGPSGGKEMFNTIVALAFLLSCGGCLLTADVISNERREGTLGLLLLTRVTSFDVLLGKLGSVGITCLSLLVAFIPVLMLPILAGGLTGGDAWRKALGLLSTLFLALSAGLEASAAEKELLKAARRAVLVLAGLILVPALLAWMWGLWGARGAQGNPPWLGLLSPLFLFSLADAVRYPSSPGSYWISLAAINVLSCLMVALAARRLRWSLNREAPAPAAGAIRRELEIPAPPERARWNVSPSKVTPIQWLVLRQRGVKAALWSSALAAGIFQAGLLPFYYARLRPVVPGWFILSLPSLALNLICGALFAWAVTRFIATARRSGELELLITTPVGAATLVSDQWRAFKRLLIGPVLVMLAPIILRLILTAMNDPFTAVLNIANLVLGVAAMCWVGFWFGLKAPSQSAAVVWTVGITRGVPYLLTMVLSSLFAFARGMLSAWPFGYMTFFWAMQIALLFFWLVVILESKRRLNRELGAGVTENPSMELLMKRAAANAAERIRRLRHWTPPEAP